MMHKSRNNLKKRRLNKLNEMQIRLKLVEVAAILSKK
jgi:hypothetical protein